MLTARGAPRRKQVCSFALTLFLRLVYGPIRCLKTYLRVRAIAERLCSRSSAAAERDGFPVGTKLIALSVGNGDGAPH
jgi:hypothetical protein